MHRRFASTLPRREIGKPPPNREDLPSKLTLTHVRGWLFLAIEFQALTITWLPSALAGSAFAPDRSSSLPALDATGVAWGWFPWVSSRWSERTRRFPRNKAISPKPVGPSDTHFEPGPFAEQDRERVGDWYDARLPSGTRVPQKCARILHLQDVVPGRGRPTRAVRR